MTARLAAHPDVASRAGDVLERLVAGGVDVELVGPEPVSRADLPDPLDDLRDGSLDMVLVGARALRGRAAEDLVTVAVLPRDEFRDVLVTLAGPPEPLRGLAAGTRVGVRSARRLAFLRAHRPNVVAIELDAEQEAALAASASGLGLQAAIVGAVEARMMGMLDDVAEALDPKAWLPEPGKGALALVARHPIAEATAVDHLPTRTALRTELALLDALDVGPDAPVGSLAQTSGRWIRLWAAAASVDGLRLVRSDLTGPLDEAEALGVSVARQLTERGIDLVMASAPG